LEDLRRRVRHEPDGERAVGDAPAVARLAHVRLVGVIRREVAGDPGEEIDVGLRHRLADGDLAAEGQRGEGIVCHGRDGSGKVPAPARGGPAMADTVRVVEYFYVETPNTPGVGAAMLSTLRDARVNLLAFSGFPSGRRAQIDFVPEDAAAFRAAARAAGWDAVELRRLDWNRAREAGRAATWVEDAVRASRLPVACVGVEFGWMWADGAERTRLLGVFDEQCARAKALGAETVMSPVDKGRGDVARAAASVREVSDIAARHGVRLAVEFNSQCEQLNTLERLREVLAKAAH